MMGLRPEPSEVAENWLNRLFIKNTCLCKDLKSQYTD